MILDTSALVAILQGEEGESLYVGRMAEAVLAGDVLRMSAANLFELALVIDGHKDDELSRRMDDLLAALKIEVVDVDAALAAGARRANQRFGRKFHSARLNFGDCFAYALAEQTGEPLLFKGADFAQTDVVSAV